MKMWAYFLSRFCRCRKMGFSLVESILALALFAMSAFVVSQICYNCAYPLDMPDKDTQLESDIQRAIEAVLAVTDYDSLSDEIEIDTISGDTLKASCEAEPTPIADLFALTITIEGKNVKRIKKMFVVRPSWYEISSERDDIIDDRSDFLEDSRKEAAK